MKITITYSLLSLGLMSFSPAAIINGVVLFEARSNPAPSTLATFNPSNLDANNDNTPDDPNVLLRTSTDLAYVNDGGVDTASAGAYGSVWITPTSNLQSNLTARYSFELYDADGIFSFAENIDDTVKVTVNGGAPTLNDTGWNITSAGTYTGSGAGWYQIEVELGEFTGTGGPSAENSGSNNANGTNWTSTFGLGFSSGNTAGSLDANRYGVISATSSAIDADPASGARIRAVLVPEPTTIALAGLALIGLGRRRRA